MEPSLLRDDALTTLLGRGVENSAPDRSLLDAFTSDTARQQAVLGILLRVGADDPAAARRLLDDYITDPTLRRRADQALSENRYR